MGPCDSMFKSALFVSTYERERVEWKVVLNMDSILLAKQRRHHQIHQYDLPEVALPNGWRAIERSSIAIKEKRFIFDDLIISLRKNVCVFCVYKDRLHMTFSCWKPISLLFDAELPTHFHNLSKYC